MYLIYMTLGSMEKRSSPLATQFHAASMVSEHLKHLNNMRCEWFLAGEIPIVGFAWGHICCFLGQEPARRRRSHRWSWRVQPTVACWPSMDRTTDIPGNHRGGCEGSLEKKWAVPFKWTLYLKINGIFWKWTIYRYHMDNWSNGIFWKLPYHWTKDDGCGG